MGPTYPVPAFAPGRTIDLGDGRYGFVRERPGPPGAPVVLLLHGWIAPGGLTWYPAVDRLAERYRVLMVDLRGFGRGPRSAFSFESCADDGALLLDRLGIDRAVVVGYSLGGQIAPILADRHPDQVAGLVLVSAVAHDHNGPMLRMVMWCANRLLPHVPAPLLRPWWVMSWWSRNSLLRPLDEVGRADPRAVVAAAEEAARWDTTPLLRRVRVPVVAVISARDRLVAPALQRQVAGLAPHWQMVEMAAGHLAPWWRPARFAAAVREGCDRAAAGLAVELQFGRSRVTVEASADPLATLVG